MLDFVFQLPFAALNSRPCLAQNLYTKNTDKLSNGRSSSSTTCSSLTRTQSNGNIQYGSTGFSCENGSVRSFENSLSSTKLPSNMKLDRSNDLMHIIVVNLIQKISKLSKSYSTSMPHNEFLDDIEVC